MAFTIQTRDHNGKWKNLRFGGPSHSHIETAISAACHLDQDGLFTGDVRIVDETGKVVMKGDNRPALSCAPSARAFLVEQQMEGERDVVSFNFASRSLV